MAPGDDLKVYQHQPIQFKNAMFVEGLPSVGLLSSIAANFLVNQLELDYIGAIHSDNFHPTTVIYDGHPLPPMRLYAGDPSCEDSSVCDQVIVLVSEFKYPNELIRPLVRTIFDWLEDKDVRLILSMEAIPTKEEIDEDERKVMGLGTSEATRNYIDKFGIGGMTNGVITGLSGVLLYEAERQQKDVLCLLTEADVRYPAAKAAATLIEVVDKLLPNIKLDPEPLFEEAEKIEGQINSALAQAKPVLPSGASDTEAPKLMYG